MPTLASRYPRFRYMGSKHRLLPWLEEAFNELSFETALDAFSGSGCVSYLIKTLGKSVTSNDFMSFSATIARALVANSSQTLGQDILEELQSPPPSSRDFIARTFDGIFFEAADLKFLDRCWGHLATWPEGARKSLVLTALIRSCMKRQPRGVFTVAGDSEKHKDGRRDLRLSLAEHFEEQIQVVNATVFDNGRHHQVCCGSVFDLEGSWDLVYLDPPYAPRANDNCYIKRYHFLEGLSNYWDDTQAPLMMSTKVKKLEKRYTPFSYRRDSMAAFERMFAMFQDSTIVMSYSSNAFPDLEVLESLLLKYKSKVEIAKRPHRYSFGTHAAAKESMRLTTEFLIIGT